MSYYAVKKGYTTGIFNTWDECKVQVRGFSGAEFKKFATLRDAHAYLSVTIQEPQINTDMYEIWCDGSYSSNLPSAAGYGFLIVKNNEVLYQSSGITEQSEFLSARNVAGEIIGVLEALHWCKQQNIMSVNIHFDYQGIQSFADGSWKAKTPISKHYLSQMKDFKDMQINFTKIKAHSGVKFNNMADNLAKNSLKIHKEAKEHLEMRM